MTFGTDNNNANGLNQYLFGYAEVPVGRAGSHLATVTSSARTRRYVFEERLSKNIDDGYPLYYTIDTSIYPYKVNTMLGETGYELSADRVISCSVYYIDPFHRSRSQLWRASKR